MSIRTRRGRAAVAAAALSLTLGVTLAGCTSSSSSSSSSSAAPSASSNGIADFTTAEIVSRMKTAAKAAETVHVKGDVGGSKIDVQLGKDSSTGTIGDGTADIKLMITPAMVYIQAPADYYKQKFGEAAATLLSGKWLAIPANDPSAADYEPFKNAQALLDNFLSGIPDSLEKGKTDTINGIPAISLTGGGTLAPTPTSTGAGATLWVATIGQPYPLQIKPNEGAGQIDFLDWNKPVTVTPPNANEVVDLSKLQ